MRRWSLPILAMLGFAATAAPASAWELAVCADPEGLPFSSRDLSGYDNRIAQVLAEELGAEARFVWLPDHRGRTALAVLHSGACDAVMGVLDGQPGTLTSHAYYRSGYVFVGRAGGAEVTTLDDPAIAGLRVGVPGGARRTTPPAMGLTRRGLMDRLVHFAPGPAAGTAERAVLAALEADEVDLGILWGPLAGPLANGDLTLRPVLPEIDMPFLPMSAAITVAVRPHDEALRDAIDAALAARWDDIEAILAEAGVPLLPLPRPAPAGVAR